MEGSDGVVLDERQITQAESIEKVSSERLHLVYLPPTGKESQPFTQEAWPDFDQKKYDKNLAYIQAFLNGIPRDEIEEVERASIQRIEEYISQAQHSLHHVSDIHQAPPIVESITDRLPGVEVFSPSVEDAKYKEGEGLNVTQERIKEIAAAEKKDLIILSTSHVATLPEIQAIKEVNPHAKIGLIIFDRHIDFYSDDTEGLDEDKELGIWRDKFQSKANFIYYLLRDHSIEGVSIIGSSSEDRSLVYGDVTDATAKSMHEIDQRFPDKISIVDEQSYTLDDSRMKFSYDRYLEQVRQQVRFLKESGADTLVISVDPDVLQLSEFGYTATEYNPASAAISLGVQDYSLIEDVLKRRSEKENRAFSDVEQRKIREEILINACVYGGFISVESYYRNFPMGILGHGLPLRAVGDGIEAIKDMASHSDLQMGVPLPQGGRFLGDVTELSAPDYRGRMAKAVAGIVNRLQNKTYIGNGNSL